MPNWCQNSLGISGDAIEITKFREWLDNKPLTLNKILPMPAELEDTISPTPDDQQERAKELIAKYGAADWCSWHVNNWGTKWDVDAEEDEYDSSDTYIRFNFDSAWAPPEAAIIALGKQFPNLTLTLNYREDGMCFAGTCVVNGEDVEQAYYLRLKRSWKPNAKPR